MTRDPDVLLALLRRVEWQRYGLGATWAARCPICGGYRDEPGHPPENRLPGHHHWCELAHALYG